MITIADIMAHAKRYKSFQPQPLIEFLTIEKRWHWFDSVAKANANFHRNFRSKHKYHESSYYEMMQRSNSTKEE